MINYIYKKYKNNILEINSRDIANWNFCDNEINYKKKVKENKEVKKRNHLKKKSKKMQQHLYLYQIYLILQMILIYLKMDL